MTRRVGLFALIAVVVVVAGWYAVFWRSENAHLAAARAQEQQSAQEVTSERGTLFGLEVQHKKLAQDEATLHQLIKALPNGPSLDEMMDTLNAAATQSGVVIGTVSTPTPQSWASSAPVSNGSSSQLTGPGPESIDVSLTVGGTEAQVLNFVKALDDQPRIYVVNSFALTAAGAGPLLPGTHETASLSVNMFFESASSSSPVFPG
jgi:Tfp pilus assembly protein PilO